jgi:hypothetical protein
VCFIARSTGSTGRSSNKLLIEDVNDTVDCDVVSDGGHHDLVFDYTLAGSSNQMHLSEPVKKSRAAGCVVRMDVHRDVSLWRKVGPVVNVRRRTVWIRESAFHILPLGIAEHLADAVSSEGDLESDEEESLDPEPDDEESLSDESQGEEEWESDSDEDVIAASGGHCEQ